MRVRVSKPISGDVVFVFGPAMVRLGEDGLVHINRKGARGEGEEGVQAGGKSES